MSTDISGSPADHLVLATVEMDDVSVGRTDDGHVAIARPLTDETATTMEDVVDQAHELGLAVRDARADLDDGKLTVIVEGSA